jgi:NAD/NADP transhydrogenase beta subunit
LVAVTAFLITSLAIASLYSTTIHQNHSLIAQQSASILRAIYITPFIFHGSLLSFGALQAFLIRADSFAQSDGELYATGLSED